MKRFLFFLCSFFIISGCAFSNPLEDIKIENLPNGHIIVVKEQKVNPIVIIDTFVKTGSVNENDSNNGVAHFLEHLFFKGTTNHKRGEFERIIESRGGVFNAATSRDYTHYYIKIDKKYFDEALALHSDMLLNVAIPQNELDMERKVVIEEISRSLDNPENKVFDNFMEIVFNGTPYSRKILGTNDIIKNITRDEILAFHHTWYKPENMVTVVVGDIDADKAIQKVSKSFNSSPNNMDFVSVVPSNPKFKKIKNNKIEDKFDVNTGYLILGYPSVGVENLKEAYALNLAATIFANGQNSVLYKALKVDENIALALGAGNYELKNNGVFYVTATFLPHNYQKVLSKIKSELQEFKSKPIDENRLNLVKNALKREYVYANEGISSISSMIGYDVAIGNGIKDYTDYLKVVDSITPEFIYETLNKYLNDDKLAVSVLLPNKKQCSPCENIKNISLFKKSEAKLVSSYKNIKKYILPNGATLIIDNSPNNDVVATKIFVNGGSVADTKDGVADILAATIKKGTLRKSGKELEDSLDNIGTSVSVSNGLEYFEISMKTTKEDFSLAIPLLKEIVQEPAFNQKDINNAKSDAMSSIKAIKDSPHSIAFENFNHSFYDGSVFLKSARILEKTIPTISAQDVKDMHSKLFSPKNMIISIVGNVSESDAIKAFSSLKNNDNSILFDKSVLKSELSPLENNLIVFEPKNSSAAWLVQGWKTQGFSSKDFVALKLISMYLGSGFSSQLFINLRENKGLAYEVGASSSSAFNHGMFFMYIGTNPQNIEEVKVDFNKEIENLKTQKISAKELAALKSMMLGKMRISSETNMTKAFLNGYYEVFDKGYRFSYDYHRLVEKVTPDDIYEVANRVFSKPYIMSIVADEKYLK